MTLADIEYENPDPLRITMEHRWGERISCRLHISIEAGEYVRGTGRIRDVSVSGAFLECTLDVPLLARISVAVVRDGPADTGTVIPAIVVRRTDDGVGVEWCDTHKGSICQFLGCTDRCITSARTLCDHER